MPCALALVVWFMAALFQKIVACQSWECRHLRTMNSIKELIPPVTKNISSRCHCQVTAFACKGCEGLLNRFTCSSLYTVTVWGIVVFETCHNVCVWCVRMLVCSQEKRVRVTCLHKHILAWVAAHLWVQRNLSLGRVLSWELIVVVQHSIPGMNSSLAQHAQTRRT